MKKFVTISAATIAAGLVLAGCSAGGGSMPGMNHGRLRHVLEFRCLGR